MPLIEKKRIAFFDFACCEGCQLAVLQLEEKLLDMLEAVDIVNWREVMSNGSQEFDVAFCEGSITRKQDIERLQRIRETADILVSLGSCASIPCHNALKNDWEQERLLELVYGEAGREFDTIPARPITAVVAVDYQVRGCPASLDEFVEVFKYIMTGKSYEPPHQPVCVECKYNDQLCVYEKGAVCLGPVTRCGCDAICTRFGDICHGCRGLIPQPNLAAAATVLKQDSLYPIMAAVSRNNRLSPADIQDRYRIYNRPAPGETEKEPTDP